MEQNHRKKIKFILAPILFFTLCAGIYYTSYQVVLNTSKDPSCREIFDSKTEENQKRICCDATHYNNSDEMCGAKCDFLNINPESEYCQVLSANHESPALFEEKTRPELLDPKCKSVEVEATEVLEGGQKILRVGKPIKVKYQLATPDTKVKNYQLEFFTFDKDFKEFKPVRFEDEKNFSYIVPATDLSSPTQSLEFSIPHSELYRPDLTIDKSFPSNVLMVLSTIDKENKKILQSPECYVKLFVDNSPSYCTSFKVSNEELEAGQKINFSVVPAIPEVFGYKLTFQNINNKDREISFTRLNNKNESFVAQEIPAKDQSKFSLDLSWNDFNKTDLNSGNIPENIRALAYVIPNSSVDQSTIAPCVAEFKLEKDSGVSMCKNLSFSIKNGTTGLIKQKGVDANYDLLTSQDTLQLKSESKSDSIEFSYNFFNLDNLNSKKVARPISFEKNKDFIITKTGGDDRTSSIEISHSQLDKKDLNTSKNPKKVQVIATFKNEDGRLSKKDKECTIEFRVE